MRKIYQDGTQGQIEAALGNAFGSDPTFRNRVDNEQLTGATMLRYNIFYDEAKERVKQALINIHGISK